MKQDEFKVSDNLTLVKCYSSQKEEVKEERIPTNWVICTDFSGSMYYELSKMADYLSKKIATNIPNGDKVTLSYFSGRNQYGSIIEGFDINDSLDKEYLTKKIKGSFKTIGLTGFEDPLRDSKSHVVDGYANSLLFLTDGYDNQSTKEGILKEVGELTKELDNFTIIEFGDYCNHSLLEEMVDVASENVKASLVYSKNLGTYENLMDSYFADEILTTAKIEYQVPSGVEYICYDQYSAKVVDGVVRLPESVKSFNFLLEKNSKSVENAPKDALLSLVYLYTSKMQPKTVYKLLSALGDVKLWEMYSNAIGVQKINAFKAEVLKYTQGAKLGEKGFSNDLVVDENAYCVLNLLKDLASDENNKFFVLDDRFQYKSIGSKKVQRSSIITEEEKESVFTVKDLHELAKRKYELKFVYDEEKGHTFRDLVFNETEGRANISIRTHFTGVVNVEGANLTNPNLKEVRTFRYRNYTIVKDGIVNVDRFVVSIADEELLTKLKDEKIVHLDSKTNEKIILEISSLPIINLSMVKGASFERLAKAGWEMNKLKAQLKVVNSIRSEMFPKKADYLLKTYSDEVVAELKEIGIDHNGFAPKTVLVSGEDEDTFPILKLDYRVGSRGGLFNPPSLNAVIKKIGKNMNIAESLMAEEYTLVNNFLNSAEDDKKEEFIIKRQETLLRKKRILEYGCANIKFSVLVSQTWFNDIDPNTKEYIFEDDEFNNETIKVVIDSDVVTKKV